MSKTFSKGVSSFEISVIGPSEQLPTADLPTLRNVFAYFALLKIVQYALYITEIYIVIYRVYHSIFCDIYIYIYTDMYIQKYILKYEIVLA